MSEEIKILGVSRNTKLTTSKDGWLCIAFFDVKVRGFSMFGCALRRSRQGHFSVVPPRLDPDHSRRRVKIDDQDLRLAMTERALEAFRGMGATDEEITGQPPRMEYGPVVPFEVGDDDNGARVVTGLCGWPRVDYGL
ncbi:hypothetical protein FALB51S_02501 [Frigidibacter albus]